MTFSKNEYVHVLPIEISYVPMNNYKFHSDGKLSPKVSNVDT